MVHTDLGAAVIRALLVLTLLVTPVERDTVLDVYRSLEARVEAAGIDVPPLELTIGGEHCEGIVSAYYQADPARLVVCQPESPRLAQVLLHELGHHIDHALLTDIDRARLMAAWGTEAWNDRSMSWGQRGSEQWADAFAWLFGEDTRFHKQGTPESEWEIERVGLNAADLRLALEVLLAESGEVAGV